MQMYYNKYWIVKGKYDKINDLSAYKKTFFTNQFINVFGMNM